MKARWVRRACLFNVFPCFVFLGASLLPAQVDRGSIVGTVNDSGGGAVPEATVTVTNKETNESTRVATDASGDYAVRLLHVGRYTVTAEKQGFQKTVQPNVVVDVNQVVRVDFVIQVGAVTEVVEVKATPPLVETETSSIGTLESERRIVDLPLNGRIFIGLAYLGTGANSGMAGTSAGGSGENVRGNLAVSVNGLRVSDNNFLLDGVDNNEFGNGNVIALPPPDAIQEFRTEENSMNAEFGRGGASVNAVLKSGTNQVHGTLYEFVRNDKFDAANFFAIQKPELRQNQFGGSLGGPIRKDRTFIFGDVQIDRVVKGIPLVSTVPNSAEKGGDFSDRLTGTTFSPCGTPGPGDPAFDTGTIFDPLTTTNFTCSNGTVVPVRTPFAGNIIPPGRLNAVAQNVVALYPAANIPGQATNNYVVNGIQINNQKQFDIRGDHRMGPNDQFFSHFTYHKVGFHNPNFLGDSGGPSGSFAGNVQSLNIHSAAGWTHTFSPSVVNDLHGGYFRFAVNLLALDFGKNRSAELGIPGANRGDINSSGLTQIGVGGFQSLGDPLWFPELVAENIFQIADTLSRVKGRHSLKFGVDFRRQQRNFFQVTSAHGILNYDGSFTNDITTGNGGNGLASLELGVASSTFQDFLQGRYPTRYWDLAEFVQDDFHATPNLTLNLGLRYEVSSPPNGRIGNFYLSTLKVVDVAGPNGKNHAGVTFDKNNFGPRVGFAYTPFGNKKTVIRSAFGVLYATEGNLFDDLGLNPPYLTVNLRTFNKAAIPTPGQFQFISEGFVPIVIVDPNNPSGLVRISPPRHTIPYILEWNFSIQRQLAQDVVLTTAYVGTHAVKLWDHESGNFDSPLQPLDTNFGAAPNFGRPYFNQLPNLNTILPLDWPSLATLYHSLQVSLNKRFSHGTNLLAAYTLAKNLGTADGQVATLIQNSHSLSAEKSRVDPDFRHRLVVSYLWELPVGRGQRFLNNSSGVANALAGGWQVSGITEVHSGGIFTPILSFDPTNTGTGSDRGAGARPDLIHDPYDFSFNTAQQAALGSPTGHQTLQCFYNPAAFVEPGLAPGQTFAHQFGNAGRNILRGPDQVNFDFSVFKDFRVTERHTLQFRAEFFNVFNHPEFQVPASVGGGSSPVTNPDVPGGAAITSTVHDNREIQFALKWIF